MNPGISPVEIHYRDEGAGPPLILLHGGWGYRLNPFNYQLGKIAVGIQSDLSHRSGYRGSTPLVNGFARDFHYYAAVETRSFLDASGIERAFFWGHSDGAVIAAILAFTAPERVGGLVLKLSTITE